MSDNKDKIRRRLQTIEGHIRAVTSMVEQDKYCIDIIHQTQAIKHALDKVEEEILGGHLNHCATTALRSDDLAERERVITELLDVFKAKNKF